MARRYTSRKYPLWHKPIGRGAFGNTGRAADQIIRVADEVEADLIVIGGRGKGAVEAIVLGSVAYRVLHHAPCPVLLVTR